MRSLDQGPAAAAAWQEREVALLAAIPDNDGTLMRRMLDFLYDGAAWLAALAMIGVLLMVLLSVASRQFGFHVGGTDAYAGYSMAAAGFLALAHTLKRNEHIRVTLILGRLKGKAHHALEMWALTAAVFLSGLFAFYSVRLAWVSRSINDMSTGSDATPLWIPQIAMAVGTVILFIAFVDDWVLELQGKRVVVESEEALHNE
jgi:TRAP-type C4-dicarboxylate transport system permease small subunit